MIHAGSRRHAFPQFIARRIVPFRMGIAAPQFSN